MKLKVMFVVILMTVLAVQAGEQKSITGMVGAAGGEPGYIPALAADPAVITHIDQRPWIINSGGVLKSETELTIENRRGQAVDAWLKIRVPGKPDCMESFGSLIGISEANVTLTTAKMADANGEGIILRFNEIKGKGLRVFADGKFLKASEDINSRGSLYCFQIGF